MKRTEFAGVQILLLDDADVDELSAGLLTVPDGVNVIRAPMRYPAGDLPTGFAAKPTWISWVARVSDGVGTLLASQSSRERRRSRKAQEAFTGLDIRVHEEIDPDLYDRWLAIYTSMVDGMEHGLNIAADSRDDILKPGSRHLMATVERDGELVGGWVMFDVPRHDMFRMRFAAFEPTLRELGAARSAILLTADWTRDRKRALLSLGNDINFYSNVLKPGLLHFKTRLGFHPTPTNLLPPDVGEMVFELVECLDGVSPLALAYIDDDPSETATADDYIDGVRTLRLVAYVRDGADVDLSLYEVDPQRVHGIPVKS